MMKDFKKIIIAMIVACVIAASILVGGSSVDAATIKVKSGADVTEVEDSGKKIAYMMEARLHQRKVGTRKVIHSITLMAERIMLPMCGIRNLASGILLNGINPRKLTRSIRGMQN